MDALNGREVYKEAVEVIEEVFHQQALGSAYYLKRLTMEHPNYPGHLWHNIRILPGMVPGIGAAAVRLYSGYRGTNRSEVICLFNWDDMGMVAIISDYHLHAIRTAAPYGVAVKYLAPPDAKQLGIIGTGRYARGQVQAACAMRDIRQIKAYSRSAENRRKFCQEMQRVLGIEVLPTELGREAIEGADIVITATSGNTVVLEGDWLKPGVLVMSVAPGEFDERTVERSRVILAGTDQVLGDKPPRKPFASLVASGKFTKEDVAAEFYEVVAGKKPGRLSEDEITLFESPGMGILDVGVASWVYRLAKEKGIGMELPFGEKLQ
ncbi:MAG: ornithine cyclodeaminase family protein [Candidatus Methylomirabilales bacterium]